ncbi:hypothetical protein [Methanoregula sp.]|uniref:hypothetical protein n=1 Tax=Methanoregula sp. TaxID=2052170 RepID=UPI003BB0B758
MDKQCVIDTLGWGLVLWLIGYVSGILLFFALPVSLIGWAILPVGVIITFWVLFKQIRHEDFRYYAMLAVAWTAIAVACDYVFIVVALKPADGYYKPDVYLYYVLTVVIPLIAGWWKKNASRGTAS